MKTLCCLILAFTMSCAHSKKIGKETVEPYGLFNLDDKNPNVRYKLSIGNVVLSTIFVGAIVPPIVLGEWYLWEPVEEKRSEETSKK